MDDFGTFLHELNTGIRPHRFPLGLQPQPNGLVAQGGHLSVEMLLEAYSKGYFPWSGNDPIPWFCPTPRLLLFPEHIHVSKSLRKRIRKQNYTVRMDTQFRAVMEACSTIPRKHEEGTWITSNMIDAYEELHRLHIAHSVEVYMDNQLVGGLYGLSLGAGFFGESMFSRSANASKLALHHLCSCAPQLGLSFIDCQVVSNHLLSMGGVPIERRDYLALLAHHLQAPSHHYVWTHLSTQQEHSMLGLYSSDGLQSHAACIQE